MTVVGGGVIGTEYACVFAALGTRITLVEGRDRLLSSADAEFSAGVQLSLERMGSEIVLGDAVVSLERDPAKRENALRLKLKSGRRLRADKVLFSSGRGGNTAGLNLDGVGVALTERGNVKVDEHFRTSVPHIYAAGDVVGAPGLASASMEQGRVAACHAFDIPFKLSISSIQPYGIYSIPEISSIGPTEQELREKNTPYEIGRARYENNARGQITGDSEGMIKILFDPLTRNLIGAHILGEHATELIHIPMFVMASGGTIDAFIHCVFNFPTLSEAFKYAAYDGLQRLAARQGETTRPARSAAAAPATRQWFLGLAVPAAPVPGSPVTVCDMDRLKRVRFRTWSFEPGGDGLVPEEVEKEGFAAAVSGEGTEAVVKALRPRYGIVGEVAPESAEIVRARPDVFFQTFGRRGHKKARQPRNPEAARRIGAEILASLGIELPGSETTPHFDQLAAAADAFTAYLWATGRAPIQDGAVVPQVDF